jgi:hypothetical protein
VALCVAVPVSDCVVVALWVVVVIYQVEVLSCKVMGLCRL